MQNVLPHAERLITNFMSAFLADNRDAHENDGSDNEKTDVKLSGQADFSDVHRIINTKPAKHKDEPRNCFSVVTVQYEDWDSIQKKYEKLYHKVFVDDTTHIPTACRVF